MGEKQYAIKFSYANDHLGSLLGIKRKDQTIFGIFSMPFHNRSNLNVGYGFLDSTINYFDDKYLILSVSFR